MVYLKVEPFGTLNSTEVLKYTWEADSGLSLSAITYGAIITSILVPDKNGQVQDVVMGFDDLDSYVNGNIAYFGATIGRVANRIGGGSFELDGVTYELFKNIGANTLHGGKIGFDKVIWTPTVEGTKVTFSYLSKDGEEGYPGDLIVTVSYDVTEDGLLKMEFKATSTKKTIVNLTNHSYFNLAGHCAGADELYEHRLVVNADKITETDADSIPTGKLLPVGGTIFDLRTSTRLGDRISKNIYDDNFCVSTYGKKSLTFAARALHPKSGRFLEVYTDQPGVQLYTGNGLPTDKPLNGKGGAEYKRHGALCLETQNYPDAINHPEFPSPILKPGDVYSHLVHYRFGVEK